MMSALLDDTTWMVPYGAISVRCSVSVLKGQGFQDKHYARSVANKTLRQGCSCKIVTTNQWFNTTHVHVKLRMGMCDKVNIKHQKHC